MTKLDPLVNSNHCSSLIHVCYNLVLQLELNREHKVKVSELLSSVITDKQYQTQS
jgi:hypothetical protein